MFIWKSMLAMTVIDIIIIIATFYLYFLFYKYRRTTAMLDLALPMKSILFGLGVIQLFYGIDLFSMVVLPYFTSMETAMSFMKSLHLNWRWLTSLVGMIAIFWGLSTMFPRIDLTFKKIKNMYDELDVKNRELEAALNKLQQAQLQLVQGEKMSALGNLVAGIAHEINNPISFLSGNIDPAKNYVNDLFELMKLYQEEHQVPSAAIAQKIEAIELDYVREDLPKIIDSMQIGVDCLRNISTSLRTFSRTDKEYKISFDLRDGIDSTLLILKHRLKANKKRRDIEIIKKYGDLPQIKCFPGQLNQVLMNLLANAIDALDECSGDSYYADIENKPLQIEIKTEMQDGKVIVRICDNGVGMTEEVKNRIFEQGFTTKPVGKGTGLGMAIARQIVEEKHGGTLTCTSELGKGTEFAIALPIVN